MFDAAPRQRRRLERATDDSRLRSREVAGVLALYVALVCLAVPALAAPPEICGTGLDEDSSGTYGSCAAGYANTIISTGAMSGCDLLCPAPDQDGDGYTTTDCDDTNRMIFPRKTWKSGSNYYTCNTDGSTTNNGTSLPTGTNTYYVNCDTGSGTTCSLGSPCGTIAQATSGGSPGSPPGSAKTLAAGDRVWWQGTCTGGSFSDGTQTVFGHVEGDGSSGSPIIIEAVPGTTAVLSIGTSNAFGLYLNGDYNYALGGEYTGTTSPVSPAVRVGNNTTGVRVEGGYFHDLIGNGNNNFAAIYAAAHNSAQINRNVIVDLSLSSGNVDGVNGIISFHNGGGATYLGSSYSYNVFSSTRTAQSGCGTLGNKCFSAIRFKHGLQSPELTGSEDVYGNKMIWPEKGVYIYSQSDVTAKYNLIYEPYGFGFFLHTDQDLATFLYNGELENVTINRNTVVNGGALYMVRIAANSADSVSVTQNVFTDDIVTYNAGNDDGRGGIFMLDRYSADADITSFLSVWASNSNCFYNSSAALTFNFFGGSAGGGEGGSSADGMLDFATWRSTTSEDAGSFSENPTLDSYHRATASNCDDYGYMLTSEEGPTPTPTPTPAATPTPTPVPTWKENFSFYTADPSDGCAGTLPADTQYAGCTTGGAGSTNFSTTANGVTFGFVPGPSTDCRRTRDTGKCANGLPGIVFYTNNATDYYDFRVTLPAPGTYNIRLAIGDTDGANTNPRPEVRIYDTASLLATVGTTATIAAGHVIDATGTDYTYANWITSNTSIPLTFTTTEFHMRIGRADSSSGDTRVSFLGIEAQSSGGGGGGGGSSSSGVLSRIYRFLRHKLRTP